MKKNKILIIEDDRVLVEALKFELKEQKYNISVSLEGDGAYEKVLKERPDIILLDLVLPGTHGFEILKKIKENSETKNIPVIVATNLGEESDKKKAMGLGAEDYFVKASVDLDQLSEKISKILSKK